MSGAATGYDLFVAQTTFQTYLGANKIHAPKTDVGTEVTEADSDTQTSAVWMDQFDDYMEDLNDWFTGNRSAPGPLEIGDGTALVSLAMVKDAATAGTFYWYNEDTTASDKDFKAEHDASENWAVSRHDGSAWRELIGVTDDTAMTLLAGAQTSCTLTLGGTVATTDEGVLILAGGTASHTAVQFVDSNNRIELDKTNSQMNFYVANVQSMVLNQFGFGPKNTMNLGGGGSGDQWENLYLTDGVTAPGTPTGGAVLYVDTADGDLKVKFSDAFVATIAADS